MTYDQTNGRPAMRFTDVRFVYSAGANEIALEVRRALVLRDADGIEHEIAGSAEMMRAAIPTSSLAEVVPLHDVRTGAETGTSIQRGAIVAAINSLCRQMIDSGS